VVASASQRHLIDVHRVCKPAALGLEAGRLETYAQLLNAKVVVLQPRHECVHVLVVHSESDLEAVLAHRWELLRRESDLLEDLGLTRGKG
jgi:hypothetical protein